MGHDVKKRLRDHVVSRGGPSIHNGVWQLMLDAADYIQALEERLDELDIDKHTDISKLIGENDV
jgi:hypothetical protein